MHTRNQRGWLIAKDGVAGTLAGNSMASPVDKHLQRRFVHQEVLVRDIPGIGTRQAKHQQVTNRQLRNRLLPGQHILGRAQLAYQGDVLTAYLRGFVPRITVNGWLWSCAAGVRK